MKGMVSTLASLLVIAAVAYLAGARFPDTREVPELNGIYKVMQVHDGDTLVVLLDGKRVSVRMIGIDSPEVETPYTKSECFGAEASKAAHELLDGKMVRLETDPTQQMYDVYDRLLAYVYVQAEQTQNGVFANEYMVREGYAREYTYKDPYIHQDEFRVAQGSARNRSLGMWRACAS